MFVARIDSDAQQPTHVLAAPALLNAEDVSENADVSASNVRYRERTFQVVIKLTLRKSVRSVVVSKGFSLERLEFAGIGRDGRKYPEMWRKRMKHPGHNNAYRTPIAWHSSNNRTARRRRMLMVPCAAAMRSGNWSHASCDSRSGGDGSSGRSSLYSSVAIVEFSPLVKALRPVPLVNWVAPPPATEGGQSRHP